MHRIWHRWPSFYKTLTKRSNRPTIPAHVIYISQRRMWETQKPMDPRYPISNKLPLLFTFVLPFLVLVLFESSFCERFLYDSNTLQYTTTLLVIGTDWTVSCKFHYHAITITTYTPPPTPTSPPDNCYVLETILTHIRIIYLKLFLFFIYMWRSTLSLLKGIIAC